MLAKSKKIRVVFVIFWILLIYIIAALVFWFVELNLQNNNLYNLKLSELKLDQTDYIQQFERIAKEKNRKIGQYIGEGSIFLLLILAGAVYIFRMVRRELRQTLEQQNFMMAITHELKTPIAVTKLNLETILFRKLDDQQEKRLIQISLQETNRLNNLCDNLLLSSQIEAGGYQVTNEAINWSNLILKCIEASKDRFPGRVIQSDIEPDVFIHGDILLLEMVVNNLIENAIKYAPKVQPVALQLHLKNKIAVLKVIDLGPGIDQADKEKVFKKFSRLGNEATVRAKGTGLGLFLVKKIVTGLKGKVYILPNQPNGCIFTVEIISLN